MDLVEKFHTKQSSELLKGKQTDNVLEKSARKKN